ncbi:MAG: response regulator [Coriobacteriales bacterium]|jgi:putative two-component system response regulator|nr:response regulator [Coriobacteriales bacterium]
MTKAEVGIMTGTRKKVILVDDNLSNLSIGKSILRGLYEVYPVPSAQKLFECLERFMPDLILLDIEMPDVDGYEAMRRLRRDARFDDVPIIFLTARRDEESELHGLALGAADYVYKPFSAPLLLKRIETHLHLAAQKHELRLHNENLQELVAERTQQLFEMENAVLDTVAEMVEFRDSVTGGHVSRTQEYLRLLINKLIEEHIYQEEVSTWNLDFLIPSAQLHDVGKIAISDAILNKPGKLTFEEFETMKTHVLIGVEAIERIEKNTTSHDFLRHAKAIAGTHHEKWDGSGYPYGLAGTDIPLEGRLMAIADVYDALISTRPYKKALSTEEAERIIEEGRGTHFDPVLVDLFHLVSDKFAEAVRNCREREAEALAAA